MNGRRPRVFAGTNLRSGDTLTLDEHAAHHLARVLRLGIGDALIVFDGSGGEHEGSVASIHPKKITLAIGAHHAVERESPLAVTLAQGISSGEKMDFTIQKAVELGVAAIQPLLCARSVVRLDRERAAARAAHWRRVAIAACEQCGRNRIPEIREPLAVARYVPEIDPAKALLSPRGEKTLSEIPQGPVILAAGPEAGFDAGEEATLERAGFVPVRLGPRILRAETAALAALAALNALAGDF